MNMKERFEKAWDNATTQEDINDDNYRTSVEKEQLLAFFHQEFLALAEECEGLSKNGTMEEESIYDMAIDDAVRNIRSKADELV